MRQWIKYTLDSSTQEVKKRSRDSTFSEHAQTMGGYEEDKAYESTTALFDKFYHNFQYQRLEYYNAFLQKHLKKSDKLLSIASGRSINELKLLQEGYDVTCSDLEIPPSYDAVKKLFPNYKFCILDILKSPTNDQYDGCLCLSLIYLFNEGELDLFFANVSKSLVPQGYLVLDSAGSSDNFMSYLIHDVLLKYETYFVRFIKNFGKQKVGLTIQDYGYRRTDQEIIQIAKQNGFEYVAQENYAFLTEFQRSRILRRLMNVRFIKKMFGVIGRNIPYVRMFLFRKVGS